MMLLQHVIGTVVNAEILIDSFALDICVIAVEIYDRIPEILDGNTVSAERSGAVTVDLLKTILLTSVYFPLMIP